ncbi:protein phosphatase 2C domain-containing protein [Paenibacillus sp. UNC451MF]|uniref:protein phosphatase 2C domain-containing protein n=1 Tax=Paenibacillus sp. UNC451MF TaxID=1449063 RepID=UPI00048C22C6|nr:protein phosphatase 2C domain-containing protein [Paenibacillus sp. UNC451MF]
MKIETISLQGTAEWNEDALVNHERLRMYGVLDGATSLHPYRGPNNETGGHLASRHIQSFLESLEEADMPEDSLKPLVVQANARLRSKMLEAGVDVTDKASLWTSGLALIRVHDTYIDFAQAGDCMIAAVYKDGAIRTLSRDQVAHVDLLSKRVWEQGIRQGITKRESLWELARPVIVGNKAKMNKPEGYSVLSGEPELADFIEYGRINRIQLKALLLVTDGLFPPAELATRENPAYDAMRELTLQVAEQSLAEYADKLVRLEREDPDCLLYPRFKVSDDKTGIWIRFE